MNRDEFVRHLLNHGSLLTKKHKNGMWIVYNESINKFSPIPASDPLKSTTMCRICEEQQVPIPNEEEIWEAKRDLDRLRRNLNLGRQN